MSELDEIDRLIAGKPDMPPERIYGWLDSQLSIARYYGGCTYQGHSYLIAENEQSKPLVRADVLKREAKLKAGAAAGRRKAEKELAKDAQGLCYERRIHFV